MNKTLKTVSVMLITVGIATLSGAKENRERRGPEAGAKPGGVMRGDVGAQIMARVIMNPNVAAELGLSEEQKEVIRENIQEIREQQIKLNADLELAGLEQAKLLMDNPVDEAAIMNAVEKTGAIRTELAKLRIKPILQMKTILTAEQLTKVREIMEQKKHERERGNDMSDQRQKRREMFEERKKARQNHAGEENDLL
ncbi:MAG: hypothetical protein JXN60_03405 [Lentisphaerae bacterium]|nr:hypothetical protein [Lentisphaerota bacterium]